MRGCCNGSQAGLRCQCPQGRGGSNPLPRTRLSPLFLGNSTIRFADQKRYNILYATFEEMQTL